MINIILYSRSTNVEKNILVSFYISASSSFFSLSGKDDLLNSQTIVTFVPKLLISVVTLLNFKRMKKTVTLLNPISIGLVSTN